MTQRQVERRQTDGLPSLMRRMPEGVESRAYDRFEVRPLSPTIGAEIEGVDLQQPVDEQLRLELRRAFLEWKVLFFPARC